MIKDQFSLLKSDPEQLEKLIQSEARFRMMVDTSPALIWESDNDSSSDYFNQTWLDFTGRTIEQERGLGWLDGVHPDDRAHCIKTYLDAFKKERKFTMQYRLRCIDGRYYWMLDIGTPRYDSTGIFVGYIGSCVNINEKKLADEALRESEEKFRYIAENTFDGIVIFDASQQVKYISPAYLKQLGFSTEEGNTLTSEDIFEMIHPDEKDALFAEIFESINLKLESLSYSFRIKTKAGNYIWRQDNASFQYDGEGNYLGATVICRDITELKRNIVLQDEAKHRISSIATQLPGVIFQYKLRPDGSSCFPYASESIKNIYGISPEDLLQDATKLFSRIHRDDYSDLVSAISASAQQLSVWQSEFRVISEDGSCKTIFGTAVPQLEEDGAVLWHGFISDVTESRKIQEKFNRLSIAVAQSPILTTITDLEGNIEYVNQKFTDVTGYSAAETLGKNLRNFKNGFSSPDEYNVIWNTLLREGIWQGAFQNRKKNGELFWESGSISAILNTKGEITHFLEVKKDATDRRQIEETLEKYAAQLKSSNAELENFAYLASHDLQEPLRMINSFLNMLKRRLGNTLDAESLKFIDFAVEGSDRMKMLINDLLEYSRIGINKDQFTIINLDKLAQYIQSILKLTIEKTNAIIQVGPLPVINANKTLIYNLFLNLVENALKYSCKHKPVIEIGYREEKQEWVFYVKDNGIGIRPEYFEKIFIIFKRLHGKGDYPGTGIGLAICKKITDIHKGRIWVESEPEKGSTFYFSIPKLPEPVMPATITSE
jgi:PAS domain S-box-containing protein